ncbi:MAG: TonB-dependent receptor [Gammaproteobacteria bacterium]|nr:TonB-dependent receptor [Gammaproteobacteria bacterium]
MSKLISLGGLLCLLATNFSILAQTEDGLSSFDDDELLFQDIPSVYSASKHEQKVTEAPSWVSIVTAREISLYGYRTLSDILNSLSGFYINYDRNYGYLGVRGFGLPGDYNTRFQLLINGHDAGDNIFNAAYIDHTLPLNLDLIERIEVVRGPSSSLYGSNAFFGVINIITKSGRDLGTAEVSASLGSQGAWETSVHYGERFSNGAEVLVSGSYYSSDGDTSLYYPEFDDLATNNGIAEDVDSDQSEQVYLQYSYEDFSLNFVHSSREKVIPTASFGTEFNDPRNQSTDERDYLDLKYQTLLDNKAELLVRISYDEYAYFGDYVFDYGPPDDIVVNKDEAYGESWGTEIQYSVHLGEMHYLTVGTDYQKNIRQDQLNFDVTGVYLDDQRDTDQWGVYLQDEYRVSDQWIVNFGLRHDEFDTTDSSTNPRLGLIYQLDKTSSLKLIYGTAFRAPNVYELYYNDSDESQKSPDSLLPEDIKSLELVYEKNTSNGLHWVASIYNNQIKNLIRLQTDPVDSLLVFQNVAEAESKGVDFEISTKFENKLELTAALSAQKTEEVTRGIELVNSPNKMAKLLMNMPLSGENILAGFELQYQDERHTVGGNTTDAFFLANLNVLAKELVRGLTVSATVYNLFDEAYFYPGSEEHVQDQIMQDGRLFRVKVKYSF